MLTTQLHSVQLWGFIPEHLERLLPGRLTRLKDIKMVRTFRFAGMAFAASSLVLAVPSSAAPMAHAPTESSALSGTYAAGSAYGDLSYQHKRYRDRDYDDRYGRYDDDDDRYDRRSRRWRDGDRYSARYGEPVYRDTRIWRGRDGRYYCRKDDGTTGLLIGAGVGALIGHEIAGRGGDRTLGAILGAAGGALLGRHIDRSNTRCR